MNAKSPKSKPAPKSATSKKAVKQPGKRSPTRSTRANRRPDDIIKPGSKQAQLLALLKSSKGAKMEQMMQATGWQAHSVRGCLSGVFRKRLNLNIQSDMVNSVRVYRIVAGQA
jgi:hypothetical protein